MFEQVARVEPVTKKVEILQSREVIGQDLQTMALPESPEKKIIPKILISETTEVRSVIKYLEGVQPSLATKEIVNAEIETIGETKKVTLMQKKNDQTTRVVVLFNEKTNEFKLVDESLIVVSPPNKITIEKTKEGQTKITTNSVEKMITADKSTVTVIKGIEQALPHVNMTRTEGVEKVEGNLVNTFTFVVSGSTTEAPKQQITVVQNKKTETVKVTNFEEIPSEIVVKPINRPVGIVPQEELKSPEIVSIVTQLKETKPEFTNKTVTVSSALTEETKFVTKYTVKVDTPTGPQTVTATIPRDNTQGGVVITSVTETQVPQTTQTVNYVSKVTVDQTTGVKTTTTSKPEDIKESFVKTTDLKSLTTVENQGSTIESVVRREYNTTVTETVVIKTKENKYVQAVFEKNTTTGKVTNVNEQVIEVKPVEGEPVFPTFTTTTISQGKFSQVVKSSEVLQNVTSEIVRVLPVYQDKTPVSTQIETVGPKKTIIVVFVVENSEEKERIIAEYLESTKTTTIKEQSIIPAKIKPLFIEKNTVNNEVKFTSNSVEEVRKEDSKITTVMEQISQKLPVFQINPVNFEVTTNPISNKYEVTAIDETTKNVVQVSVTFDKKTQQIVWNDIVESPTSEVIVTKPARKPLILVQPTEIQQPATQSVINFVKETTQKDVTVQEVKKVESLLTTTYEVKVNGTKGVQTVTVTVDNNNKTDITLVDVLDQTKPQVQPVVRPAPSITTTSVTGSNILQTTSNEVATITSNKYLNIVKTQAERQITLLKGSKPTCFYEDKFNTVVQISYLASTEWGTVQVSAFVKISNDEVQFISLPVISGNTLVATSATCGTRSISTLNENTFKAAAQTNTLYSGFLTFAARYKSSSVDSIRVESFTPNNVFVMLYATGSLVSRVVVFYSKSSQSYIEIEGPVETGKTKPQVLEQQVKEDGSVTYVSNSVEQIKTVDTHVEKFIQTVNQQVKVDTQQIESIISYPHTNTNEYTVVVSDNKGTTTQIKAILNKQDNTVQVVDVQEKPAVLIKPLIRPAVVVPKEEITSEKFTKIVTEVNTGKVTIPKLVVEDITKVEKTQSPVATTYTIQVTTPEGPTTYVVSQDTKGTVQVVDFKPVVKDTTEVTKPNIVKPASTEFTTDVISGVQIKSTNDSKVIEKTKEIQQVLTNLVENKKVTTEGKVVSAVVKTSETSTQTNLVIVSPSRPTENTIVVAVVDKKTDKVTIINEKEVTAPVGTVTAEDSVIQVVYTSTVVAHNIEKDQNLKTVVEKVVSTYPEFKQVVPSQIVTEKVGTKTISHITYEKTTVTMVSD